MDGERTLLFPDLLTFYLSHLHATLRITEHWNKSSDIRIFIFSHFSLFLFFILSFMISFIFFISIFLTPRTFLSSVKASIFRDS